jgi:crotonobetainyl-CoA:carnitine CoA-transferase CaiB-like acyl-CoA transferase
VTDASRPLSGIRVVCIAIYVPALVASQRLRELGAGVTIIEPPAGDPFAKLCPPWYKALRADQSVAVVDLKSADGVARLTSLLGSSDLLLTALRPAALERLGLSWTTLHQQHPTLCHVAIVGYPSPHADEPGHDLTYQAHVGLLQPPALPRALVADMAGAERATQAALALLLGRQRGQGAHRMEVALADAVDSFADGLRFGLTRTGADLGGGLPGYGLYETSDGWVAVAALEPHFWHALVTATGLTEHNADRASLARFFKSQSAAHWERWAAERSLPIMAVRAEPGAPAAPSATHF